MKNPKCLDSVTLLLRLASQGVCICGLSLDECFIYASQLDYVSGWARQRIGANEAPLGECLRENKFLAVRFIMQLGFCLLSFWVHFICTERPWRITDF